VRRERAWLGAGVALTLACGSGPPTRGAGSVFAESSAPGSLCATFTRALCSYLMQCQSVAYCDLSHCLAENDCYGFPQLEQAVDEGAVVYDPSKAAACFESFGSDPCHLGALPPTPDVFDVLSRCAGSLTPQLTQGKPCVSSSECGADLYCNIAGQICPGSCTPFATTGQSCAGGASCGAGLMCSSQNICRPNATAGSPCSGYSDCQSNASCVDPPCASPSLWCDSTTGTCMPGVAQSAACGVTPGGPIACAQGLWCNALASDGQGTCQPPGAEGAPCNDLGGCQTGLHCAGYAPQGGTPSLGQCALPATEGGNCEANTDCATGLVCVGGACSPPLDVGLRCNSDSYCKPGLTCATEKCLHASCPGQPCSDPNSACVLSVCKEGQCQDRARVGEPCVVGGDCTTGTCVAAKCAAASTCVSP